jgi:segregation and condensation protein B
MNTAEAKRVLETALICASEPLPLPEMRALFDGEVGSDTLRRLLDDLARDWQDRGVELVALASGWRFQSRPELRPYLDRLHPEKPPKYSRAAMETLAIVAYRQPVTRAEIETIRGVSAEAGVNKLLERELIYVVGRADLPGRPIQYGTTDRFLEFVGVKSIDELPASDVLSSRQIDEWLNNAMNPAKLSDTDMGLSDEQLPLEAAPSGDRPAQS